MAGKKGKVTSAMSAKELGAALGEAISDKVAKAAKAPSA